jgi:hypothetical protein
MTMRKLGSGRVVLVHCEPSERDKAFGLYVGKLQRQGAPTRLGANIGVSSAPSMRSPRHRRRLGQKTGALLATVVAALLAGVGLGRLEGTLQASSTPAGHRASLSRPTEPQAGPQRIAVASTIVAEPSSQTSLQVQIASGDSVPANSFVRVQGLPPATSLSHGHAMGPGAWAIPVASLSSVKLGVASKASGTSNVTFTLVAADGESLAEAKTRLVIWRGPVADQAPVAVSSRALGSNADPEPLRRARNERGKMAPTATRHVPPRVAMMRTATHKRASIRHVVKRRQQLATKARKVTEVEPTFEPVDLLSWLLPS